MTPILNQHELINSGLLTCLDGYMNVALEDTEEWSGGRLTGRFGDCFLRGNNGMPMFYALSITDAYSPIYFGAGGYIVGRGRGGLAGLQSIRGWSIEKVGGKAVYL